MQLANTPASYGAVTKTLHWVIGLTIVCLLIVGLTMVGIEDLTTKLKVYGLHKSFGIAVLCLALMRIVWHNISKRPPFVATLKRIEVIAAHSLHTFFYVAMIGMPLSGWLMSSAGGRPVGVFGLFTLPDLVAPDQSLREAFGAIHEILAYILIAGIVMHVAAALKHHFINKDATLRRMLPVLAVLLALAPLTSYAAETGAQRWAQVAEASSLATTGDGVHRVASYDFTSNIYFDPTALQNSQIVLSAAYAPEGLGPETDKSFHWTFTSSSIRKSGEGSYEARGEIQSSRGRKDVTIPFRVSLTRDRLLLIDGRVPILQGEYNFGGASALYPADLSAIFHITAKPLFSGEGKLILE